MPDTNINQEPESGLTRKTANAAEDGLIIKKADDIKESYTKNVKNAGAEERSYIGKHDSPGSGGADGYAQRGQRFDSGSGGHYSTRAHQANVTGGESYYSGERASKAAASDSRTAGFDRAGQSGDQTGTGGSSGHAAFDTGRPGNGQSGPPDAHPADSRWQAGSESKAGYDSSGQTSPKIRTEDQFYDSSKIRTEDQIHSASSKVRSEDQMRSDTASKVRTEADISREGKFTVDGEGGVDDPAMTRKVKAKENGREIDTRSGQSAETGSSKVKADPKNTSEKVSTKASSGGKVKASDNLPASEKLKAQDNLTARQKRTQRVRAVDEIGDKAGGASKSSSRLKVDGKPADGNEAFQTRKAGSAAKKDLEKNVPNAGKKKAKSPNDILAERKKAMLSDKSVHYKISKGKVEKIVDGKAVKNTAKTSAKGKISTARGQAVRKGTKLSTARRLKGAGGKSVMDMFGTLLKAPGAAKGASAAMGAGAAVAGKGALLSQGGAVITAGASGAGDSILGVLFAGGAAIVLMVILILIIAFIVFMYLWYPHSALAKADEASKEYVGNYTFVGGTSVMQEAITRIHNRQMAYKYDVLFNTYGPYEEAEGTDGVDTDINPRVFVDGVDKGTIKNGTFMNYLKTYQYTPAVSRQPYDPHRLRTPEEVRQMLDWACSYRGNCRYASGGACPTHLEHVEDTHEGPWTGWSDCSWFVHHILVQYGLQPSGDFIRSAHWGRCEEEYIDHAHNMGTDLRNAVPGDVIVLNEYTTREGAGHVGIYLGNNMVLESTASVGNVQARRIGNRVPQVVHFDAIPDIGHYTIPPEVHLESSEIPFRAWSSTNTRYIFVDNDGKTTYDTKVIGDQKYTQMYMYRYILATAIVNYFNNIPEVLSDNIDAQNKFYKCCEDVTDLLCKNAKYQISYESIDDSVDDGTGTDYASEGRFLQPVVEITYNIDEENLFKVLGGLSVTEYPWWYAPEVGKLMKQWRATYVWIPDQAWEALCGIKAPEEIPMYFGNYNGGPGTLSGNSLYVYSFMKGHSYKNRGLTNAAIAGILGNLKAESGLRTNNLEDSMEPHIGMNDTEYTDAVNNGTYPLSEFITDWYSGSGARASDKGAGYGIAQWTYGTRKEGLYRHCRDNGLPIDSLQGQLDFLYEEMSQNKTLMNALYSPDITVEEATRIWESEFEKSADGEAGIQRRIRYAKEFYNKMDNFYGGDVVQMAMSFLGKGIQYSMDYRAATYNNPIPEYLDCSSFVSLVFHRCGYSGLSSPTYTDGLLGMCDIISPGAALPGDIIFFQHTYDCPYITSHVGIVISDTEYIHCGSGGIKIGQINVNSSHFYGFGRMRRK